MASGMQKETLKSKGAMRMVADTQEIAAERNISDNANTDGQENPKLSQDASHPSHGLPAYDSNN